MEVTTQEDSDATKRFFIFKNIWQSAVKSFHSKSMLHWDLIPDDDTCLF